MVGRGKMTLIVAFLALLSLSSARIVYFETAQEFHIYGSSSVYALRVGPGGNLVHLCWSVLPEGFDSTIDQLDSISFMGIDNHATAFDPWLMLERDDGSYQRLAWSKNAAQLEFPDFGSGDYRIPAINVRYEDGTTVSPFVYRSHEITSGKPSLDDAQPAFYVESSSEATTLRVELSDPLTGLLVDLYYTIYEGTDVIIRRSVVRNTTPSVVHLLGLASASIDFAASSLGYQLHSLSGSWARERHLTSRPLSLGTTSVESRRGASSHQHNPFVIVSDGPYSEDRGEHFAVGLVYSGGFQAQAEMAQTGRVRLSMGLSSHNFDWVLQADQTFVSPEAVLVYSAHGAGHISRQMHKLIRTRLVKGAWRDRARPILINSWEAMYFNVTEDKIVDLLAVPAAELGMDLVVLDDGWFGQRDDAKSSLGDWYPNPTKFPNGLKGVADRVLALGLEFGIWMEPEMISVDSDLYREHPDWALHIPDRPRTETRNQLVLDLTRQDVRDFIVDSVATVLGSANITYLKWDFNRHLSDVGSVAWPAEQQGELFHRFVLGVYDVFRRVTEQWPDVLFESCSGGGGRFDMALMQYMPQIWASDNTDAIGRQKIQYGTSIAYPATVMTAHVSASPNEQNFRESSIRTRSTVALAGMFGYELDLTKITEEERAGVIKYMEIARDIEDVVRQGDLYRLLSPHTGSVYAWMFVSQDKTRAVLSATNSHYFELVYSFPRVRLAGLNPAYTYELNWGHDQNPMVLSGATLMAAGIMADFYGDGGSAIIRLNAI